MQDSKINYYILVEGAKEGAAQFKLVGNAAREAANAVNKTAGAASGGSNAIKQLGNAADGAAKSTKRAAKAQESYFVHIARTTIQSAAVNKAFLMMVDSIGQAVQQVDLMGNFPATIKSMGGSAIDASESMKALTAYVGQVGGNLGDATSMVTRFTGATKDVKSATAIFVGLNNALIAGDSSMEEQRNAAIQFAQALERGKPDMREWMALTQNMSFQLGLVAKEMGYVNANALGEALRNGEVSMASFTTKLTELSTGTGPIAQQAMVRMNGLQFTFNVLKNTLVQGLAAIINAFGRANIVIFFTFLTDTIKVLVGWVVTLINWILSLVNMISRLFGGGDIFKKITGDAAGVAKGLGAGAGAANDLGDGLDDASKSAKALNKSLAGFDKMNVLPDKESGGGGGAKDKGAGGGGGFDAGQVGALNDVFGNIGGKLKEASTWAKIFAGILAALAANGLISKIFGINPLRLFFGAIWKYVLAPMGLVAGKFGLAIVRGLAGLGSGGSGIAGTAATLGAKIGLWIRGGVVGAFSLVGRLLATILGGGAGMIVNGAIAVFNAFMGLAAAVATALGVSIGAAIGIIVAAVAAIVLIIWLIWTNWSTICSFVQTVWTNVWGFITTVFTAFWNWLVGLWNTLYAIFEGPVKWIWQFIEATFTLIVAIIAIALEAIFKLWVWAFTMIFELLSTVVKWIFENVITPVAKFFVDLWNGIVNAVTAAWNWIFDKVLKPIGTWIYNNVIQPVVKFFTGLWTTVSNGISNFINGFKNFFSPIGNWIKTNIIDKISGFFSGLWKNITDGVNGAVKAIKDTLGSIGGVVKAPINAIFNAWNGVVSGINNIKVPDWVPGLGGKSVNFPKLKLLAKGGIVTQPTMAMVGEAGTEAVIPLENNTGWIDMLAAKINGGSGGQPVQLVVQIGEDKIASKVIDLINEKTQMSGRNAIYV